MGRLSEAKQNLIRRRLVQNVSLADIADEAQVSVSTVKRYKKNLPVAVLSNPQQGEENVFKTNYTTIMTKKELAFCTKIQKEIMLYDDDVEGWTWHVTKGDMRLKQSGCWWTAIVYPDSAPADWREKLIAQGFRIAISPLHDHDSWNHPSPAYVNPETGEVFEKGELYKTGDRKKAHWHVIIVVDKRTGYQEMNDIIRKICHCPYIQKCRSLKNAYDYFLHINAPDKYQGYDKDEIQTYNNFHVEPTKYESNLIAMEMIRMIQEHDIVEWADCVEFFANDPEFSLLLATRTAYFSAYIKSRYYRLHPTSVKYTEVKRVSKFSFEKFEEDN